MSGNGKRVRDEEELTTGVTLGGAVLLGAKEAAFAEAIVNSRALIEPSEPLVGTMDELVASKSDDQAMVRQLRNTVKKCASCGKMCGWSLAQCNSCGADLPSEVSFSHNLFMGFVYGVGKAPFPLTISIRRQTSELVVFDDILSLSPCHLNVIPTTAFIPDWRFLLRRPAEGLRLICQLEGAAWGCVEEFLKHDAWRTKMLRADPSGKRQQDFRQHVIAGCNFPPSQFQLHIQYFMMPFLPFQYKMYLDGQHLTHKRFFPLEYIKAVLALGETVEVTMETSMDEIIARFNDRVNYDTVHAACYKRAQESHRAMANWQPNDFTFALEKDAKEVGGQPKDQVVNADKAVLQSFGRPYTAAGKPSGTYYKFAKPERVPEW